MKKFLFLLPLAIATYLPQSFAASADTQKNIAAPKRLTPHFFERHDKKRPSDLDLTLCHGTIDKTTGEIISSLRDQEYALIIQQQQLQQKIAAREAFAREQKDKRILVIQSSIQERKFKKFIQSRQALITRCIANKSNCHLCNSILSPSEIQKIIIRSFPIKQHTHALEINALWRKNNMPLLQCGNCNQEEVEEYDDEEETPI